MALWPRLQESVLTYEDPRSQARAVIRTRRVNGTEVVTDFHLEAPPQVFELFEAHWQAATAEGDPVPLALFECLWHYVLGATLPALGQALAATRPADPLAVPAGSICEVCLDAPALAVVPAPWGGDMGICARCLTPKPAPPEDDGDPAPVMVVDPRAVAWLHPRVEEISVCDFNPRAPIPTVDACVTRLPAERCTCGRYRLRVEGDPPC
jgi:hypothetical protein